MKIYELNRNMLPLSFSLNQLPPEKKTLTRKLERLQKQEINCSLGVKFLETCLSEGLLPNFTDIYIYIYIYLLYYYWKPPFLRVSINIIHMLINKWVLS